MAFVIKLRRDPAAEWTSHNPVLSAGEPGFETDTGLLKVGDGVNNWNDLGYYPPSELVVSGVASVDGRTGVVTLADLYAALVHAHAQSEVTGLVAALSGKAATVHTHAQGDVTSLVSDLAGKAASVHSHLVPPATVQLTDAATIAVDATLGERFKVTLTGDHILGNPTGAVDGQMLLFELIQDGTGGQAVTLGNKYNDPNGYFTGQSTAPGKRDKLGVQYNAAADKFDVLAFAVGF